MDYSDQQLIESYLEGNEKSLEILIKRYLKPVYSFVYRYVGDGAAAEDITQEIFVKTWRNLKKFNPNKKFKTWIFTIAKNTSIDWLKKKKAIPFSNFESREGENLFIRTLADPAPLADEMIERAGVTEVVNAAINQLTAKYRRVLLLRYNEHLSFREIAAFLSEPLNTVKSRHRRALIQLKNFLT